jgi:hypothetical protein
MDDPSGRLPKGIRSEEELALMNLFSIITEVANSGNGEIQKKSIPVYLSLVALVAEQIRGRTCSDKLSD